MLQSGTLLLYHYYHRYGYIYFFKNPNWALIHDFGIRMGVGDFLLINTLNNV